MLLTKFQDYHSGDNFQYYEPTNARPNFKYDEYQSPIILGGYHHEWQPGVHTLFLGGRLENDQRFSDTEVNEAVVDCPGVIDATTYGVEVRGADGRAGMVAIVIDDRFDLEEFRDHLARRLPAYACPAFVRICAALDSTETFKQKKQDLIRAGFDPHCVTDPLFFRDPKSGAFLPIDAQCYERITEGLIRL